MSRPIVSATTALCAMAGAGFVGATDARAESATAPAFVPMEEIAAPIVDTSHLDGVLRVSLVLQAKDAEAAADMTKKMPELRATTLAAMLEFGRLYASPLAPVDARKLSEHLNPALKKANPAIVNVLIVKVGAFAG
jgi:flagellar basal body-associated protein FliL